MSADPAKGTAARESAKPDPIPEPVVLAPAGNSSDAEVHNLLAQREIAALNGDQDAVAVVNERLAALGVQ